MLSDTSPDGPSIVRARRAAKTTSTSEPGPADTSPDGPSTLAAAKPAPGRQEPAARAQAPEQAGAPSAGRMQRAEGEPNRNAGHESWVRFAVEHRGAEQAVAEAMTRDELIERHATKGA